MLPNVGLGGRIGLDMILVIRRCLGPAKQVLLPEGRMLSTVLRYQRTSIRIQPPEFGFSGAPQRDTPSAFAWENMNPGSKTLVTMPVAPQTGRTAIVDPDCNMEQVINNLAGGSPQRAA